MPVDPSQIFGPTLYPSAGWLRTGLIDGVPTILESWDIQVPEDYVFESWAIPVVGGYPKQKTLHARGTEEVSFDLRGDLTVEGASLITFLNSGARGTPFPITVQQSSTVDYLSSCFMSGFMLSAEAGSAVKFQLSGKSLYYPTSGSGFEFLGYQRLVPSWATGNELVSGWQLRHDVELIPVWWNTQNTLPTYYRFGNSEWIANITTSYQLVQYATIALGVGSFTITGMVKSRGIVSTGRDVRSYTVELTNVNVLAEPLTAGALVVQSAPLFQGSPDGI